MSEISFNNLIKQNSVKNNVTNSLGSNTERKQQPNFHQIEFVYDHDQSCADMPAMESNIGKALFKNNRNEFIFYKETFGKTLAKIFNFYIRKCAK